MMNRNYLENFLAKEFKGEKITFESEGWGSCAFTVGENIVRFSKNNDISSYEKEQYIYGFLRNKVRFQMPQINIVYGEINYSIHKKLIGENWNIDTYNDEYGYQTLFLNSSTVDLSQLKPVFSTSSDENGTTKVYVGSEQKSGESIQDFSKGTVQYTASYNNQTPRNYWVTFAKKEAGARLFVNGPSEREVLLTAQYGNKHDILIANIGDAKLTGLKVELNATHVKLDDYWTVGGDGNDTLAPFTTTEKDYSLDYGELANLARIRLLPSAFRKSGWA